MWRKCYAATTVTTYSAQAIERKTNGIQFYRHVRGPNGEFNGVRGDREYVRQCCEASLLRLKVDHIDLYYQHRVDAKVPIEETISAMKELVEEGKVRDLGIAFIAYSPLGRGFLTGQFKKFEDQPANDYRRFTPRFMAGNFDKNIELVQKIERMAAQKGCTPAQLALAWVLAQGEDMIPIPGTKTMHRLLENIEAADLQLTTEELSEIEKVFPAGAAVGDRYHEAAMKAANL